MEIMFDLILAGTKWNDPNIPIDTVLYIYGNMNI